MVFLSVHLYLFLEGGMTNILFCGYSRCCFQSFSCSVKCIFLIPIYESNVGSAMHIAFYLFPLLVTRTYIHSYSMSVLWIWISSVLFYSFTSSEVLIYSLDCRAVWTSNSTGDNVLGLRNTPVVWSRAGLLRDLEYTF